MQKCVFRVYFHTWKICVYGVFWKSFTRVISSLKYEWPPGGKSSICFAFYVDAAFLLDRVNSGCTIVAKYDVTLCELTCYSDEFCPRWNYWSRWRVNPPIGFDSRTCCASSLASRDVVFGWWMIFNVCVLRH